MSATIAISIQDADAYFAPGNHPMSRAWRKVTDENQRKEFLEEAIRQMCAELRTDVTTFAVNGTLVPPRYDYAIFERALFILFRSGAVADGSMAGPKWFGISEDDSKATRSKAEMRWLPHQVDVYLPQ